MVSRLWRDGKVVIPGPDTVMEEGDRLLVTTSQKEAADMTLIFGQKEETDWNRSGIDWNALDKNIVLFSAESDKQGQEDGSKHPCELKQKL